MKPADFLRQGIELVEGDRAATHGDLYRNHQNIATMWNAFLSIRRDPAAPLGPDDVAIMGDLLKIARTQLGEWNKDDYTDGATYMGCAGALSWMMRNGETD